MREAVIIKSFPNGIALYLNGEMPFEDLLAEIGYKFSDARNFFGTVTMALSIEGRPVTDMEEIRILETIRDNSDINIACIVEKDETVNKNYVKALERTERELAQKPEGQFFRGDLKDREVLETENSIIVLGDVYPGACIISSKDIVVLGTLTGDVYAGAGGNSNHFVVALNMLPGVLQIGDYVYNSQPQKTPRWGFKKPQTVPKIAYTHNGEVQIESITKELLDNFTL